MKKLIAAFLCAGLIALTAAGCAYKDALASETSATDATATADQVSTEPTINTADYEDSFDGICKYFTDMKYVLEDEKNITKMDASLVGATQGNKYATSYDNKQITIELYAFDTNNDTAKSIIESVKKDGTFSILDLKPVTAYVSDNGKYLLIYTDGSIDSEKPDTSSNTYIHREEVIENFKAFKK